MGACNTGVGDSFRMRLLTTNYHATTTQLCLKYSNNRLLSVTMILAVSPCILLSLPFSLACFFIYAVRLSPESVLASGTLYTDSPLPLATSSLPESIPSLSSLLLQLPHCLRIVHYPRHIRFR